MKKIGDAQPFITLYALRRKQLVSVVARGTVKDRHVYLCIDTKGRATWVREKEIEFVKPSLNMSKEFHKRSKKR